ncbi:MAG: bifunctional DNA primase/polymerase [Thermosphaera sp.]
MEPRSFVEVAHRYFNKGFNVIPVKISFDPETNKYRKKPIVEYAKLYERRQTLKDFKAINWQDANGFAVICGQQNNDGFYFFCIDIDVPYNEALDKLRMFPRFKITRMEKTISNHLHLLYLSEKPVPSFKIKGCPIELLGKGRLVVLAPSYGYEALNDNFPTVVEDGYSYFLELAECLGYDVDSRLLKNVVDEEKWRLKKWLEAIINSGKLDIRGHNSKFYYIRCPFHPPDNHPSFAINREKYYAVDYHDGQIYNLKELMGKLGITVEDANDKKKERKIERILSKTFNGVCVEAIAVLNEVGEYEPRLLVLDGQGFRVCEELQVKDTILKPRDPRSYPYTPYIFIDGEARSRLDLIETVYKIVDSFVDAEKEVKVLITSFIILSYVQDLYMTLPYLYLVGDNESGKSHLAHLLSYLCYRPLFGTSITSADLYTYLEDGLALTIIEDEIEKDKMESEKLKVYKSGYKKGIKIPRVQILEHGRIIDYFNCFGLKVLSGEKLIENKGLLDRCIIVEMVEGTPEKDEYSLEDLERFQKLKSELLKWRMNVLLNREEIPRINVEALGLKKRSKELFKPLLEVLHGSSYYQLLLDYVQRKIEEKIELKKNSLEARIVEAAVKTVQEYGLSFEFSNLWEKLRELVNGEITGKPYVMDSEEYGEITKKLVGKRLREILGAVVRSKRVQGRVVKTVSINKEKLDKAIKKYCLSESEVLENI